MSLQAKINNDLKESIKSKDESKLATLRMIKSEIQYELTKTGDSEISDDKVIAILRKSAKTRKESAEEYRKANRLDLAEKEEKEEKIILSYLPQGPSEEDVKKFIAQTIKEVAPKSISEAGKITGKIMQQFKGQNVDGSKVSELVKSMIQESL